MLLSSYLLGAFSELTGSFLSVPSEVVKSRLQLGRNPAQATGGFLKQTRNYRHTFHALHAIWKKERLSGLYSGYSACLSVDVFFSAFSFLFYEQVSQIFPHCHLAIWLIRITHH